MEEDIKAKLGYYENVIATKIKPKLADCEAERENAAITRDACAEMRELIAGELKRTNGDNTKPHALETSVEIGERCLVQTLIPDSRTLIVDTGVKGLLVEMPLQEAMDFVSARAMLLQKRYAFAGLKASHVTEDLKEAETLLKQLRAAENNAS